MRARTTITLWIGVLVAPAAWTIEHVLGYGVTEASCAPGSMHWGVPTHTWIATVTAVAGLLAALGLAGALLALRDVRGAGNDAPPPSGRVWFMSICGIVLSPLFLAIILLSGIGALLLGVCHQG